MRQSLSQLFNAKWSTFYPLFLAQIEKNSLIIEKNIKLQETQSY